ncbi:MAG: hypothetical protein HYR63_17060 [Proteobacteria bacterium]|nr:hypothetical protein [Pseudomonadota bacterium]MBI3499945.1 hypothetical protein [Pseudomonadota bacterium]
MLSRPLAAGLCTLMLGAATLYVAQQSASGLASAPERQGTQVAGTLSNAQGASPPALRRVDIQPKDYLTRPEQLALMDASWQRWRSLTDF